MSKFEPTVAEGIQLIGRGDAAIAQRDEFAKRYLTTNGRQIYDAIRPTQRPEHIRSEVTRAVQAGY